VPTARRLTAEERATLDPARTYYRLRIANRGTVVSPVPLRLSFDDGSEEALTLPAEIWRRNASAVTWEYATDKVLTRVEIDPRRETGDADPSNHLANGPFPVQTLKIEERAEPHNRMRDAGVHVGADSIEPLTDR